MLGVLGFTVAAIVVAWFAWTYHKAYPRVSRTIAYPVQVAYSILAAVMLLLAGSFYVQAAGVGLAPIIITVDMAMLIATGFLLYILWSKLSHPIAIAIYVIISGLLVSARAYSFEPTAFIQNGILHFNLENEPRFILLGLILVIWLPASVVAAWRAVESLHAQRYKYGLAYLYLMLVIATATFFSARQEWVIIATFAMLVAMFFSLGVANLLIAKHSTLIQRKVKKHHATK